MDALLDRARDIYEGEIVSSPYLTKPPIPTNQLTSLLLTGLPRPIPRRLPHHLPPRRNRRHLLHNRLHHPGHLQNPLRRPRRHGADFPPRGAAMAVLQQEA